MKPIQYKMKTPAGPLYIVASSEGLQGVHWRRQPGKLVQKLEAKRREDQFVIQAVKQLEEYFAGTRKKFDLALNFPGTPFQNRVWRALAKIPYGQTAAYKDIAKRIDHPKAVRAVGTANGENPFCIIVPCHRVIAADGSIGGYGGGISVKRRLLAIEQR